jgi:hypothetical protein
MAVPEQVEKWPRSLADFPKNLAARVVARQLARARAVG